MPEPKSEPETATGTEMVGNSSSNERATKRAWKLADMDFSRLLIFDLPMLGSMAGDEKLPSFLLNSAVHPEKAFYAV